MAALRVDYDGQVYEFDELDLDVDEAETIQKYVGRSLGDWANGLSTCEIKSVMAMWWLIRKRAGEPERSIASAPPAGFRPMKLWAAYADAVKAEAARQAAEKKAAEEAQPDPTQLPASPSSLEPADTTTTQASAPATPSLPG